MMEQELIARFYLGYFNRAPDAAGLAHWVERLREGMSPEEVAERFAGAEEARAIYGDILTARQAADASRVDDFLARVYQNLFERPIDAEGLAFWRQRLTSEDPEQALNFGEVITRIIDSAGEEDHAALGGRVEAHLEALAQEAIAPLYIGYFDRAPDAAGLAHWVERFREGMSLEEIAERFAGAEESRAIHGDLLTPQADTREAFLANLYRNLFDRDLDAEGLAFWSRRIDDAAGDGGLGPVIRQIMAGARNEDRQLLDNKAEAGLTIAAREAAGDARYSPEEARRILDRITADEESVDEALADDLPGNDAPHLAPVSLPDGEEDTPLSFHADTLLAAAGDPDGDPLTLDALTLADPAQGTLTDHGDGRFTFTPAADLNGEVRFTASVSDGELGASNVVTAWLAPVNDAPHLAPVSLPDGEEDTPLSFHADTLLAAAGDPDGDPLTLEALSLADPAQGTLTDHGDGRFTFTPAADLNGEVRFTASVGDGQLSASNLVTAWLAPVEEETSPADGFDIDLVFSTAAQPFQDDFLQAAARLETVIAGDLPDRLHSGEWIDDLRIEVAVEAIDGESQTLAFAGPTQLRSDGLLPYLGSMTFDGADIDALAASGRLEAVALHEMVHVLGFGTLWGDGFLGLVAGNQFVGANALAEYRLLANAPSASGIPLDDDMAHWDEDLFGDELLTPLIGHDGEHPLSAMTIASLADIGYAVDTRQADPYEIA